MTAWSKIVVCKYLKKIPLHQCCIRPAMIIYMSWLSAITWYLSITNKHEASRGKKQHYGLCVKYRPEQPKHAEQVYPNRLFSPPVDFLFQESLRNTSILLRRNVSARISLRELCRLIWIDTLRRGQNVGFLAGRPASFETSSIRCLLAHVCVCSAVDFLKYPQIG